MAVRREMDQLLEEYLSSRDSREAFRRLAALAVPFYHHELVKRALSLSMDQARLNPQCPRRGAYANSSFFLGSSTRFLPLGFYI